MLRCVVLLWIFCRLAFAAEKPTLDHLFPAGAHLDTTNDVTFFGKFEPWPPKAWSSNPALHFEFTTNKGKATLIVPRDASIGPALVRLYNDEGPSDLKIFVVTDKVESAEAEPNNHFAKAQAVTNFPVTINGRLEKNGDVDSFSFQMKAGQWLDASLDSYTLMAKLDPVLRLVTTNGYQLAWNHDYASLDPRLIWQAPYDMNVVLQVFGFVYPADADIRLSGGAAGVYRLHLSIETEAPAVLREKLSEAEPNNSTNDAASITIPGEVTGSICPQGDIDRFRIVVAKGEHLEAAVLAGSRGSPLDAWLTIDNAEGKELVRNDDAGNSRDPKIEWSAPEDGAYFIAVGSVTHQGSADCRFQLAVTKLTPDFRATSLSDALTLTFGATNTLKLNLRRLRGFTNELALSFKGLPETVAVEPKTLPAKDGEFELSFVTATNATPFNAPFQIIVADKQSERDRAVAFELVSRTENNGVPGGYLKLLVDKTDQLWVTIKPPAPASEKK